MPDLPLNNLLGMSKSACPDNLYNAGTNNGSQLIKNILFPQYTLSAVVNSGENRPARSGLDSVIDRRAGGLAATLPAQRTRNSTPGFDAPMDLSRRWRAIFTGFSPDLVGKELIQRLNKDDCYPLASHLLSRQMIGNFDKLISEHQTAILSLMIKQLSSLEKNHARDLLNDIIAKVLLGKMQPHSRGKKQDKIWVLISKHCLNSRFSNFNAVFRLLIENSEKSANYKDLSLVQQIRFKTITENLAGSLSLFLPDYPDEYAYFFEVISSRRKVYEQKDTLFSYLALSRRLPKGEKT